MKRESTLSLLAAQIECAKSKAERARKVGEDSSAIEKIVGSLRLTYAALAAGLEPDKTQSQAFELRAGRVREHSVSLGDRSVPVNGPYLEAVLVEAGLELAPGQVILLEAELVRDLVEEALSRVAHDQAMAERERAQLEAIFEPAPGVHLERPEDVFEDVQAKREEVHRRKVALLSAGLALDELVEHKGRPQRAA